MWVWSAFHSQCLGWNRQEPCSGPLSTTWQADCSTMLRLSVNCSTEAAWSCASGMRQQKLWSQHGQAPAHSAEDVQHWLEMRRPGIRIGHREPIEWPPRSPFCPYCSRVTVLDSRSTSSILYRSNCSGLRMHSVHIVENQLFRTPFSPYCTKATVLGSKRTQPIL
jgi:hypothetical protein